VDVWTVFQHRVLAEVFDSREALPYDTLAQQLGLDSPTRAANLLVTAKRTYARLLRAAVAEYELDADKIDQEIAELRDLLSRSNSPHA
jgi:predicted negative regulator of RcsB-dependent stress response